MHLFLSIICRSTTRYTNSLINICFRWCKIIEIQIQVDVAQAEKDILHYQGRIMMTMMKIVLMTESDAERGNDFV